MRNADNALAQRMLQLAQTDNLLQMRVEQKRLNLRRSAGVWMEMGQNQLNFPRLPLRYILDKTSVTSQVCLASACIQDTLGRDRIQTQLFERGLIRARLYSRFTQARKHTLYISYNELNDHNQGPNEVPISSTYCSSKVGARTLGVCANVASVIWFLRYANYEENILYRNNSLLRIILDSAERKIVDNIQL
ncbi:hypothetical protein JTB14_034315 [Gonioctena quinquepunctata]|nr:hypothetical protein JTB14_034315 [Gonioctena quinquepunctata]